MIWFFVFFTWNPVYMLFKLKWRYFDVKIFSGAFVTLKFMALVDRFHNVITMKKNRQEILKETLFKINVQLLMKGRRLDSDRFGILYSKFMKLYLRS